MKRLVFLLAVLYAVPGLAAQPNHKTGAKVDHAKWARAVKFNHNLRLATAAVPETLGYVPQKLTMWGNDQYGDCVTAEVPSAIYGYRLMLNAAGANIPEISITDAAVISWARAHGGLNGAMLDDVMSDMQKDGLADTNKILHLNGTFTAVDYTSQDAIKAAYASFGPLKIAIASGQLDGVVNGKNGWVLTGARRDNSTDHCTGIHGYGRMGELAKLLGTTLPAKVDPNGFGVLMYTWSTVGIVDWSSLQGIMASGECWARDPVDLPNGKPYPKPPTPAPGPTPNWPSLTGSLFDRAGVIDGVIVLTIPASQQPGTWKYLIQRNAAGQYSPAPQIFGAEIVLPDPTPVVEPKPAPKQEPKPTPKPVKAAPAYCPSCKPTFAPYWRQSP